MWNSFIEDDNTQRRQQDAPLTQSIDRLLSVAVCAVVALFLSSFLPAPLVAPTLEQLLIIAMLASVLVASVRREGLPADRLTAWDQAAMLFALSTLAGMLVDPQAAQTALEELQSRAG